MLGHILEVKCTSFSFLHLLIANFLVPLQIFQHDSSDLSIPEIFTFLCRKTSLGGSKNAYSDWTWSSCKMRTTWDSELKFRMAQFLCFIEIVDHGCPNCSYLVEITWNDPKVILIAISIAVWVSVGRSFNLMEKWSRRNITWHYSSMEKWRRSTSTPCPLS